MSISINNISYIHLDRETLFQNISFSVTDGQKISLIGNNGTGKSTLLKILSGNLQAFEGDIICSEKPYYVPQHFGQYDHLTVAQVLGIDKKLKALQAILEGDASEENFETLNEDWNIEEKALSALSFWRLKDLQLSQTIENMSGGEKTKLFLSGIIIHSPSIILLDEPSNHLDVNSRKLLYDFIKSSKATIIIVSHDRTLLNLIDQTYELTQNKVEVYGGNYEFYKAQKEGKLEALQSQLEEKEKALRLAKKTAQETAERKQKMDARGKSKQVKSGMPKIMMNTIRNKAEASASKLKDIHSEKITDIRSDLSDIRQKLPDNKEMKLNFEDAKLHSGKILVTANEINFGYTSEMLWEQPINFQIRSGDRFGISGANGKGKTSLLKLILGELKPTTGDLTKVDFTYLYVDQEYSIIKNTFTVLEQVQEFNVRKLPEHELKTILHRYLFPSDTWNKTCDKLSGGEKMRLVFCCLMVSNNMPDIFILDEPTNNLDISSLEIVTSTVSNYRGTLVIISHDIYFMDEVKIDKWIHL